MKCANCDRPALYVYEGAGMRPVAYCDSDLPRFLQGQAKKGALKTTDAFAATQRSALSALAPVTAVVVDAPAPEPTPAPSPAPKKRRRKAAPKAEAPAAETTVEDEPQPVEVVDDSVEEQPED